MSVPTNDSKKICDADQDSDEDYEGKDLWNRWVLRLEWKAKGVIDGESKWLTVNCDDRGSY